MIQLTEQNCIYYLLNKGIISREDVVTKIIWVEKLHSRNNNYAVRFKDSGFLIKQVPKSEEGHIDTLRSESCVYWLADNYDNFKPLKQYLAPIIDYNYQEHILITTYLNGYRSLYTYYYTNNHFYTGLAEKKAKMIHAYSLDLGSLMSTNQIPTYFRKRLPWSFNLPSGDKEWFNLVSAADTELLNIIQSDDVFKKHAEQLRTEYQFDTLVHGDVKWANFLIKPEGEVFDLRLIDWETADLGEAAWDVACIFQSYFYSWTKLYFSNNKQDALGINQVTNALQHFWKVYKAECPLADEHQFLLKTIRYSAFRMLQILLEQAHQSAKLTNSMIRLLQFSQNQLQYPEKVMSDFFNIQV
ncbi:MAG: phosphotransferase [Sphingobacteriaceae bacterium]|nr:phosphotransferase [Sphingobacteriaceae bacterium]